MRIILSITLALSFMSIALGQIVKLVPENAGPEDEVTVIFDASVGGGELLGAPKVYMHHGVVQSSPNGTDWNQVIGNWGQDDGVGEMTRVPGESDQWQLVMSPSVRSYFGVPTGQSIFRISAVFRSADGNTKASINQGQYDWGEVISNGDAYINLSTDEFVIIKSPTGSSISVTSGIAIPIEIEASSNVTSLNLFINDEQVASAFSGSMLNYNFVPTTSGVYNIRALAVINGQSVEVNKQLTITLVEVTVVQDLPEGIAYGINYHDDPNQVTLVLQAPDKDFVHVVGNFNNWTVSDDYKMFRDPDGESYWLTIEDLEPGKPYVYQYWVDGEIKIGDPYALQVADPWNDQFIPEDVFPNLPFYNQTEFQTATVLQTDQPSYSWSAEEGSWERPDVDHLVIYELLIRDFLGSHSYQDLIDTLSYIKNLGVNAIELMPISEFEGNESWGYNPSFYFAVDKYYGTPDDLKAFIDAAHQEGLAVILDIVYNHAYGQNPWLKLYFDESTGRPSADNPWFNPAVVGPFDFGGGDFNHESRYTQEFIDRCNQFWLEEFHFDGFRFDFTKGFTNRAPGNSLDGFDQSRIDILTRMGEQIRTYDEDAYLILEHFAPANEEAVLASEGFKMWSNRSYDYVPATIGAGNGNFAGTDAVSDITYFNSHDERRIADHVLTEGQSSNGYNTRDTAVMLERVKMAAAFNLLMPGPKLMWMFDELGYDINIDFNGRVGNKPLPWGENGLAYYDAPLRQYVYDTYRGLLDIRNTIGPEQLAAAETSHVLSGQVRQLVFNTTTVDLVVVGNFGITDTEVNVAFPAMGNWNNYFFGDVINVSSSNTTLQLAPGEWHVYTSTRLSEGLENVVEVWENPVSITPYPFNQDQEIRIVYDASKGSKDGTSGLEQADKVYMHSGVVLEGNKALSNITGTLTDDGLGQMTSLGDNLWEINIVPNDYYGLEDADDAFQLGMYFRDADNFNVGKGFRGSTIYYNVVSADPFIQITPRSFDANDEITIRFNAKQGNRELIGANKVYMHSSVDITDTETPQNTAWNHVIGNWGMDDGVGEMSAVSGESDVWEITITPRDYYNLNQGDFPYWLAAVFRNADGSQKGTGSVGALENGFIHTNLDFFIRNDLTSNTKDVLTLDGLVYPNPTSDLISWKGNPETLHIQIYNTKGELVLRKLNTKEQFIDLSSLLTGLYYIKIETEDTIKLGSVVRQ